jgi:acyl-CoA synthetase
VVAAPSATFGERVCAYLVLEDEGSISLEEVRDNLRSRGISKETWPEFLVVVDELPISSGGKVAKVALRDDVAERVRAGEVST